MRHSRTLRNGGLIRCQGQNSCPELEDGKCSGHVQRQYIRECYERCMCAPFCKNRVVQGGVQRKLEVQLTETFMAVYKGVALSTGTTVTVRFINLLCI